MLLEKEKSFSEWTTPTIETQFNFSAIDPNTTADLSTFSPEFQKLRIKIWQYANFTNSSLDDFSLKIYSILYANGTYSGHTQIHYMLSEGVLVEQSLEFGNQTGRCRDNTTLTTGLKNVVTWQLASYPDPPALVNSTNKKTNFSYCEGDMSLEDWYNLIRRDGVNYVRTITVAGLGNPYEFIRVKFKRPSCEYDDKRPRRPAYSEHRENQAFYIGH